MIEVTFYKIISGEITRIATLERSVVDLNLLGGEAWIEGHHDHKTKIIVDGVLSDISAADLEQSEIDQAWVDLRQARGAMLVETDWTQVPDAPVDQQAWATYRQELRDLPDNTTDPRNPVWPTKPA